MGCRFGRHKVAGAVLVVIAMAVAAAGGGVASLIPPSRHAMSWRDPVSVDQQLRIAARDAQWPMLWIGDVCEGPLYQLRGGQQLRNATYAAACPSKVKIDGESTNLMFARYATPMLAVQDVHNQGYTFFVLRPWRGMLFMAATVSDETVVDRHGHTVAPSLLPLELFGLAIVRGTGAQ